MKQYLQWLADTENFRILENAVRSQKKAAAFGLEEEKIYITRILAEKLGKRVFIVVPDEQTAGNAMNYFADIGNGASLFPEKDYNFRDIQSSSRFVDNTRIETLTEIRKHNKDYIIIPAGALCGFTPRLSESAALKLTVGEETDFDAIADKLTELGYERFFTVSGQGQFSIRGGILDIFPPSEENPYRIEFFGNETDSISIFDVLTQRRSEKKDSLTISPAKENSYDALKTISDFLKTLKPDKHIENDMKTVESGNIPAHGRYLPLQYKNPACILDYITQDDLFIVWDYRRCADAVRAAEFRITEDILKLSEEGYTFVAGQDYCFKSENINERLLNAVQLCGIPFDLSETEIKIITEFSILRPDLIPAAELGNEINKYAQKNYQICIATADKDQQQRIISEYPDIPIFYETGNIPFGFILPDTKKALFNFRQKTATRKIRRSKYKKGDLIQSFSDIQIGDYVVHDDYGIGIYDGIHQVDTHGVVKDYIKIQYKGTDTVYIPCEQLNTISKYNNGGDNKTGIKVSALNGADWKKTKARVKTAVNDIADKLIALYGARLKMQGFAFSPDTEWQRDFEASFPYEETEDQLRATNDIKADMESTRPMDRLLCGDVGFGKTEVALRAVFKCVMDGKQAAIAVPTTILANQHFRTMKERFGNFPINIDVISGKNTAKQQEKSLTLLRQGKTDVIVGTHRLFSKDIKFKDLGLIVIDEEQRFGVAHKETLKEMNKAADVLALSATPIPRTLNMSLSGIRDISILNEAPQNRFPVTTYVAEHDMGIIADAIKKEVYRGGQCFYLHNNIETIYKTANAVEAATGIRVGVAHGKMSRDELNDAWMALVEHEIDVLVCTTIVETGVDVPNCNTLIVDDADRLGLSQLHQIRGRVGRTDKRAYAYFFYKKNKNLSEDAYKRLMAVREFTEFGSGLKIAMRDMEIRGSGNILGGEQSGHMMAVGYNMYMEMLEQAVNEKKNNTTATTNCKIELKITAHIPEKYIADSDRRIEVYKLVSSIENGDDYSDVLDELIDRFGEPPKETISLLDISLIRATASTKGITSMIQKNDSVVFYFKEEPDMKKIGEITAHFPPRTVFYSPGATPYLTHKFTDDLLKETKELLAIL